MRRNNQGVAYVYLSHGRDDPDFLTRLVKHLVPYHVSVRYDTKPDGPWRFETVVRPLIDDCAAMLVVGSADGYPAPVVLHEVEYATSIGKPIQLLDRGGPIPTSLSGLPRIGLRDGLPDDDYLLANQENQLAPLPPRLPGGIGLMQVLMGTAASWRVTGVPGYVKAFRVVWILILVFFMGCVAFKFLGAR